MDAKEYIEFLKSIVAKQSKPITIQESTTTTNITPVPKFTGPPILPYVDINPDKSQLVHLVNISEFEWKRQYVDEDVLIDSEDIGVDYRTLMSRELDIEEIFDIVYGIVSDDNVDRETKIRFVSIALERFFEEFEVDAQIDIHRPIKLFFLIYRYIFNTNLIGSMIVAAIGYYLHKNEDLKYKYLADRIFAYGEEYFSNIKHTIRCMDDETIIELIEDDKVYQFIMDFLLKVVNDTSILTYVFGIDQEDFSMLLSVIVSSPRVVYNIIKHLFAKGKLHLCKYNFLVFYNIARKEQESETKVDSNDESE